MNVPRGIRTHVGHRHFRYVAIKPIEIRELKASAQHALSKLTCRAAQGVINRASPELPKLDLTQLPILVVKKAYTVSAAASNGGWRCSSERYVLWHGLIFHV